MSDDMVTEHFLFGAWYFDIQAAQRLITARPRNPVRIDVASWARFYGLDTIGTDRIPLIGPGPDFDAVYAMTADLEKPLILATLDVEGQRETPLLIDGCHRLYRAHIEQHTRLPAYALTRDESLAVRRPVRELRR